MDCVPVAHNDVILWNMKDQNLELIITHEYTFLLGIGP